MSADEQEPDRQLVFEHLERLLGTEVAAELMRMVPPMRWEELATKKDLEALRAWMAERLDDHDRRFDEHDRRFDEHDRRFDALLGRLDDHDGRFDDHDRRFDDHDRRFDDHDRRFDGVDGQFAVVMQRFETTDERIERSKNEILAAFRGELLTAVTGQTRQLTFTMAATVATLGGVALVLARFG
jgi:hypothetical protein